jgi:hypothetical protein
VVVVVVVMTVVGGVGGIKPYVSRASSLFTQELTKYKLQMPFLHPMYWQ